MKHSPVTLMTMLLFTLLAHLCCTGKAACAESDASPRYRDKVEITSFTYGSLTPYWKISGLGSEGDSSAASDRLAVTEGVTVNVYSLKTKEKIFSRSYQESEAAGEGSYPQPSLPCHLSPDGKRLAILLRKAQRVEVIDISTGAIERSAIPAPSLLAWSDMGDCLLVVGNTQALHIIPQALGKKARKMELLPPEGVPPEFKGDYEVVGIHLMPDNRTLYFKALFTITSGIYGMDMETGRVKEISYGEGRTIRFSTTSQYLFDMTWEHPGDGYLHIGPVTSATAGSLKAGNFVDSSTGTLSPAFAALGPWCAFSMDMVRTPGSAEVLSSIELLFIPDTHVFRLITGPQDQVGKLSFSWFRQMLIVDMRAPGGRAISVFDPRSFLSSGK